jgi:hypothetical protein
MYFPLTYTNLAGDAGRKQLETGLATWGRLWAAMALVSGRVAERRRHDNKIPDIASVPYPSEEKKRIE